MACSLGVSKNFLDYYFVKWGLKKESRLALNTSPDPIIFNINTDQVRYNKGLLKSAFRLVKENRIRHYKDKNKMMVYSKDKKYSKELDLDIDAIETIEMILSLGGNFEEVDRDLFMVELSDGLRFLIRKTPVSDIETLKETVINGEYSFLYPYVKEGVVLDVGAYIGDTSVMFCLNGAKNVFAYEPDPRLFDLCVRNVSLNNVTGKVETKNYGVSDKEHVLNEKGYSFVRHELLFDKKKEINSREIQMQILSFPKIIEEMDRVDVLKMDCEGAEFPAILSTPIHILKKIKVIGMECHADPKPLIDHLEKADFRVEIKKEIRTQDKYLAILFAVREQAN